jgi:excisionase family DNA binding protein
VDTKYLKVPEAADYLGTSVRFVRRLIAERRIAFHKLGTHVRLAVVDLEEFRTGRTGRADHSRVRSTRSREGGLTCQTKRATGVLEVFDNCRPGGGRHATQGRMGRFARHPTLQ